MFIQLNLGGAMRFAGAPLIAPYRLLKQLALAS